MPVPIQNLIFFLLLRNISAISTTFGFKQALTETNDFFFSQLTGRNEEELISMAVTRKLMILFLKLN